MDWPMLLLRLGVGGLFVYAAYLCTLSFDGTASDTALLVGERLKKPAAVVGILVMLLGGLSVLFDYRMRLGAAMLAGFLVGGTIIHRQLAISSFGLRDRINSAISGAPSSSVDSLAGLASVGHVSSGLKNLALLGVVLYLVFKGSGSVDAESRSPENSGRSPSAPSGHTLAASGNEATRKATLATLTPRNPSHDQGPSPCSSAWGVPVRHESVRRGTTGQRQHQRPPGARGRSGALGLAARPRRWARGDGERRGKARLGLEVL
jgi:uncharacterized membrane protein YphA (DoxX/SURF4 family)